MMKANERFVNCLRGDSVDRMPLTEIAFWWDDTVKRWQGEGLPKQYDYKYEMKDVLDLQNYFGLDMLAHWWVKPYTKSTPFAQVVGAGMGGITMESYEKKLLPTLYPEIRMPLEFIKDIKTLQSKGLITLELILNGAFWEPREYMGIEPHLFSFYDEPELYHRMTDDMLMWQTKVIEYASNTLNFDFVTIAEDMSYNGGSMLSKKLFDDFIAPYYKKIVPILKNANLFVIVDSDGNIEVPIEWFNSVGVQGYQPLEKQSGVDVNNLQELYPNTAFVGNFDKMVMNKGRAALIKEFERLLPSIKKGKYIVSCDHQTPPSVSLNDYMQYIELLKSYAEKIN